MLVGAPNIDDAAGDEPKIEGAAGVGAPNEKPDDVAGRGGAAL